VPVGIKNVVIFDMSSKATMVEALKLIGGSLVCVGNEMFARPIFRAVRSKSRLPLGAQ